MPKTPTPRREIRIEGYTAEEILRLPAEDVHALVLTGEPVVFRIGSATVLGEFRRDPDKLVLELAQIEGGGEGVLLVLGSLARRFAEANGIASILWIVHAIHCAKPNPKLRRVLERRGFAASAVDGVEAYRLLEEVGELVWDETVQRRVAAALDQLRQGLSVEAHEARARFEQRKAEYMSRRAAEGRPLR